MQLMIHTDAAGETPKSFAMVGNAMFAMVLSSTDIAMASRIDAIAQ